MTLTVGSLFSGIGGIDLGLERAGMRVVWQSEIDPYCSRVLAKHWPDVPNLGDITKIDWSDVERPDLICGGFPCQPVSVAGKRRIQADDRWLWPEFARALRHLRPRVALMENVPGLLVGGGMGEVLGDLAALGYDAEWESIPAAAVGAPHLRYRVFIVAYSDSEPLRVRARGVDAPPGAGEGEAPERERLRADALHGGAGAGDVPNPDRPRLAVGACFGGDARAQRPTVERSDWWAAEPDVGRVAHGVPSRVDRLRALGNGVVPQVAEWVGRRILETL